jgi:hypothetical protein
MELGVCTLKALGKVTGPGCNDVKLGSEAPAGESRHGFEVGKDDENAIRNNFLNCNIASLTRRPHDPKAISSTP